jgi:hypothetical protein
MRTVRGLEAGFVAWVAVFGLFTVAVWTVVPRWHSVPDWAPLLGEAVAFFLAGMSAGAVAVWISPAPTRAWVLGAVASCLPPALLFGAYLAFGPLDGDPTALSRLGVFVLLSVLALGTGALGGAWEQRRRAARAPQVSSERA